MQQQISSGQQSNSNCGTPIVQASLQGSTISLGGNINYKPFISEKELIQTITIQESEITTSMKLFTEVIPRNFRLYKEYGDRIMNNGERMRLQLIPSSDCKDLFTLLFQLGQFFEIIGRLFSQNYNNVSLEIAEPINDAVQVLKNHKDLNLNDKALKILPKAHQLHQIGEKQKLEYEKATRDAQDYIQRMKNSKQDPNLMYNLTELTVYEEKATKAVRDMEDKKHKYQSTLEKLDQKNQLFISALEILTKEHQGLIEFSAGAIKRFLETDVNTELIHYENLNLITPEKAQVIRNFVIKQDMNSDIKIAEEQSQKIDLTFARQKILDLNEGSTTHQAVAPYCQFVCDTSEYYSKVSEKWSKYLQIMIQFVYEMSSAERQMVKAYKELNIPDKKRRENQNQFGPLQGAAYEYLRTLELKERNHINFSKFLEQLVSKIDSIVKTYKQEEKYFVSGIQKLAKDLLYQNDKIGKQTMTHERQLVKISQMLSSNFQGQNEKMASFQSLMIEYTHLTDTLKENYSNFKSLVLISIEQEFDLLKSYKKQQKSVLKELFGLFQDLTSQEQTLVDQQQKVFKEFTGFVDIIDTSNLINQFKCQIINKHQVEFVDYQQNEDEGTLERASEANNEDEPFQLVEDQTNTITNFSFQLNDKVQTQEQKRPESVRDQLSLEEEKIDSQPHLLLKHESFSAKDLNSIDVKIDRTKNEHLAKTSTFNKMSQSVIHKPQNTGSIISPMKKQLERLSQKKEDLFIDEQTQRDFDQIKVNMNQMFQSTPQTEDTPDANTKFIQEKFMGLLEGEQYLENYSCAISLKILIQGRLYVTNKRLLFHSYFNDKTIFGKETKISIPISDLARVAKKTNVMVFDNSLSVFTKDDREIFFTSFVTRDHAHSLISDQITTSGVKPNSRTQSLDTEERPNETHNRMGGEVGKENKNEYSQGFADGQIISEERDNSSSQINLDSGGSQEAPEPMIVEESIEQIEAQPIYDNAYFLATEEFKQVEADRLSQARKYATDLEGFSFVGYEEVIDCSLKHVFFTFINYNLKWKNFDNLSILEWLDKFPLTNINISFDKPDGLTENIPEYFTKSEAPAPTPSEFKNWPLNLQFNQTLTHITEKPKFMQPKSNKCKQDVETFLISPRLIVRKSTFQLEGIPFADSFNFDYKLTFEQLDGGSNGNFRTRVKSEFRVNILKPIRFLQSTVVRETEASLRDTYAQGAYKEGLLRKIIELKGQMKDLWNQSLIQKNKPQHQKSQKKSVQILQNLEEESNISQPTPQQIPQFQDSFQDQVSQQDYAPPIRHSSDDSNIINLQKDVQKLNEETIDLKNQVTKLIYAITILACLNFIQLTLYMTS